MTGDWEIVVNLPGIPVGKGRPKFTTQGGHPRAVTPAKTRNYEAMLRSMALDAMGDRVPMDGPLEVHVIAVMPIPTSFSKKKHDRAVRGEVFPAVKPDWENLAKTTDGLNGVVWTDDARIVEGRVSKRYGERPSMTIKVRRMVPLTDAAEDHNWRPSLRDEAGELPF